MSIAAAIIAGGRSRRMGGEEKAFKTIGGANIIAREIAVLHPSVAAIVINANGDAARFASTGLGVIADAMPDVGTPLAGLHAGLAWAVAGAHDWLVTVPADTPFLPHDLVEQLRGAAVGGAAIASSGGRDHYIAGIWRATLKGDLERAIRRDGLVRVQDWAARAGAAKVQWPTHPYDPFFNVNTPEDLAEAMRVAAEFGA